MLEKATVITWPKLEHLKYVMQTYEPEEDDVEDEGNGVRPKKLWFSVCKIMKFSDQLDTTSGESEFKVTVMTPTLCNEAAVDRLAETVFKIEYEARNKPRTATIRRDSCLRQVFEIGTSTFRIKPASMVAELITAAKDRKAEWDAGVGRADESDSDSEDGGGGASSQRGGDAGNDSDDEHESDEEGSDRDGDGDGARPAQQRRR